MDKQPKTRGKVIMRVFMQYHKMEPETQARERAYTILTFADRGIKLDFERDCIKTIVAGHKMERVRLGRILTDTELHDLIGWAA